MKNISTVLCVFDICVIEFVYCFFPTDILSPTFVILNWIFLVNLRVGMEFINVNRF